MSDEFKWLTVSMVVPLVVIGAAFIVVLILFSCTSAEVILAEDALLASLASGNKASFYSSLEMLVDIILQSFIFLVQLR